MPETPVVPRLVDIALHNRTLSAFSYGERADGPVVVCEAGLGSDHYAWDAITEPVSRFATLVTYDRAGYGRSGFADDKRSFEHLADDLLEVCRDIAKGRPVLLVGHSLGGRIVRVAAMRAADQPIAGLVLIEPAGDRTTEEFPRLSSVQTRVLTVAGWLAPLGIMRLKRAQRALVARRSEELEIPPATIARLSSRRYWRLLQREWLAVSEPIGPAKPHEAPVIALFADKWKDWGPRQVRLMGADSTDLLRQMREDFAANQDRYPTATALTVTDTTHHIQHDRPESVVDAIREVLSEVPDGENVRLG